MEVEADHDYETL